MSLSKFQTEKVTSVHHWNDTLFSFTTTRRDGLRFENGHFLMIGLPVDGKPLLRAYSIVSPNYAEHLEFLSIKVQDGPLTSRLQHLKVGDEVIVGSKPTGTLITNDLRPGKNLFLFATGTGLAPFMSIIRDPETYDKFERIILVHSVRWVSELAYRQFLTEELHQDEYIGELVDAKFTYYPTVTREDFETRERLTTLVESGRMAHDLGLPQLNPQTDRAMICGGPSMLADIRVILDKLGFTISPGIGEPGDYVIERAFVEK